MSLKASFVMATNGTVDSIAAALAAVQNQTYENLEVVLVIDRPTGEPERQAFRAAYPRVVFVFLDRVHYLPAALNAGIAAATGDIIVRCDDDDICEPDRVAKQVELIETGAFDFVWSSAYGKREGDERKWIIPCPPDDATIKRALLERNVLVHSTLAGTRAAFQRAGLYNPSFIRSQDYELYLRAMRMGMRFGGLSEPLVTRYYGSQSITVKHRKGQILFSFAAQILHGANAGDIGYVLRRTAYYVTLLLVPDQLRAFKRWISTFTGRGR